MCDRIAIINHGKLIANEPTRDLIAKAQDKAVVVEVDRDIDAAPVAPCFDRIELTGAADARDHLPQGPGQCRRGARRAAGEGLGIVDVSTRDPDLEDVFLSLTREPAA